jgi:hypothetical protein
VLTLAITVFWIIRREWFPLKERSPYLVIQTLFGNLIYQMAFPLTYLYSQNVGNNFLTYLFCAFYQFGSANLILPYVIRYFCTPSF